MNIEKLILFAEYYLSVSVLVLLLIAFLSGFIDKPVKKTALLTALTWPVATMEILGFGVAKLIDIIINRFF